MIRLLSVRLLQAILVMVAVTAIAFIMFRFVGDPVASMVREGATQAEKDALRAALGLDRSIPVQFVHFVGQVLTGNLGTSFRYQQPVTDLLLNRLPATLELVVVATVLSLAIGIPLGVLSALKPHALLSRLTQSATLVGISMPTFVTGLLLILVFAVNLRWLPSSGRGDLVDLGLWQTGFLTLSGLKSLILPSITLALFQLTLIMRLVRSEMIDVLSSDYIRFAFARGLPKSYIYSKLALRNALMPVVTVTGLQIGQLIAFAIVTETVFQWPGMGLLFTNAVGYPDIPVLSAYLLFVGFLFVFINMIVDILYTFIDPRLRTK
ncbi:MAG: ABC transporter permease [Rhizobiales bacterium 63-7]|nr:ABC transporter permease [Hyphomicrobiales bacterium]OJU67107.1 MAG: ABC transporter permease [Rhizobiales bacterium 63-7]